MEEAVFTFATTHNAFAAEAALLAGGLAVRTMALPAQIGAGCGICLRVDAAALPAARRLLAAEGVQPEGVYRRRITHDKTEFVPWMD